MQLHVGIDDTDSVQGGCTTYIAAQLVERLSQRGLKFIDYPNIIRLNPNVPYKTRGNAAVALRLEIPNDTVDLVRETVLQTLENQSDLGRAGTDPAAVFLEGNPSSRVRRFSRSALWDMLSTRDALRILKGHKMTAAAYGTRIGLVGALAAVGQTLEGDHTFELIAYRRRENYGKPRRVDENSVIKMDRLTSPRTFNNYDFEHRRILITPHGPDPVLAGVRGESATIVRQAFRLLKIAEPIERWVIFRTNHGTDAHLNCTPNNVSVKPNRPAVLRGIVAGMPERILGGHVFFDLRYCAGRVRCAAYEPTGKFREIAANLAPRDEVVVYGGVKRKPEGSGLTVNLEKIRINSLSEELRIENPICPHCGKHLKSAGKGQGFRCERCSVIVRDVKKQLVRMTRDLGLGLYLPTPKAHRHLTKPLCRYGHEKRKWNHEPPSGEWHKP